jgi:hypothetical protein
VRLVELYEKERRRRRGRKGGTETEKAEGSGQKAVP